VVVQVMLFDGSFSLAKFRPGKDAEAEVDHGRIHRKERTLEPKPVMRRDRAALVEQHVKQTFIDLMGTIFHRIRQCSSFDVFQAQMIPFFGMYPYVSQFPGDYPDHRFEQTRA